MRTVCIITWKSSVCTQFPLCWYIFFSSLFRYHSLPLAGCAVIVIVVAVDFSHLWFGWYVFRLVCAIAHSLYLLNRFTFDALVHHHFGAGAGADRTYFFFVALGTSFREHIFYFIPSWQSILLFLSLSFFVVAVARCVVFHLLCFMFCPKAEYISACFFVFCFVFLCFFKTNYLHVRNLLAIFT